ncbi:hypothetical protein LX36DRAFT_500423 [Colletotrichum falcatum]|nr:hypothetical protein LX36DRAFT_500423 [Colletotrichum falcatum]
MRPSRTYALRRRQGALPPRRTASWNGRVRGGVGEVPARGPRRRRRSRPVLPPFSCLSQTGSGACFSSFFFSSSLLCQGRPSFHSCRGRTRRGWSC